MKGRLGIGLVIAAALLLVPASASATLIQVTSTADSGGDCTLRNAIIASNGIVSAGACPAGQASPVVDTIDLSGAGAGPITLGGPLPDIADDVNIVGPGSGLLSVDGANAHQPFSIPSGKTVSISGLTISQGLCDDACGGKGGAINNNGTLTLTDVGVVDSSASDAGGVIAAAEGGGIENNASGTLHLTLSTVTGNNVTASGASTQNGASGGGIMNFGTLTLDRSTVQDNDATGTGTIAASETNVSGGGIDLAGPTTLTRSTVSGNTVTAGNGGTSNDAHGGGIATFNAGSVALTLDRTTVTGNTATASGTASSASGGGINSQGSSLTVTSSTISGNSAAVESNLLLAAITTQFKNTIVSNPLGGGANCSGADSGSLGFNIEDTDTCGFGQPSDQPSTDPLLDTTLANNGGLTKTLALLSGSPAIEAGNTVGETTDQRGLLRPSDVAAVPTKAGSDGSDIGAFEVQGQPFPGPPKPVLPVQPVPPAATPVVPTTTKKKCKKKRKHRSAAAAKKKCHKKKKK
jgi:hypothetical protein